MCALHVESSDRKRNALRFGVIKSHTEKLSAIPHGTVAPRHKLLLTHAIRVRKENNIRSIFIEDWVKVYSSKLAIVKNTKKKKTREEKFHRRSSLFEYKEMME